MKTTEYATMAVREKTYWWHLGRLKILEAHIAKFANDRKDLKILNVGCGTGGTIKMLERFGTVDNVDVSDEAIAFMKENGYKRIKKVDGIALPYKDKTYDLVGAFDVLEHIENDTGALIEWKRVLKKGGAVILSVPAYHWLWSGHDVSLHHFRRYNKEELKQKAKQAGLTPARVTYAIVFSLPLIVGFRFVNNLLGRKTSSETSYVDVPGWVNSMFASFLYAEAKIHRYLTAPAGTSVVAILRKP